MLKRISVSDVCLGMFIHELCGSWMEHPFWKTRFLLKSQKDLQRLRDSAVRELWIDTSKGLDIALGQTEAEVASQTEAVLQAAAESAPLVERVAFDIEVQRAIRLCHRSKEAVIEMFGDVRLGRAVDTEEARGLVEEITQSVARHPNALISLVRLKKADEYTYMHSVAVCALMVALARQLGLDEATIREAGLAGLFHDVGKVAIPDEILNKPGKLTDAEFAIVRGHPEAGSQFLMASPEVSELALEVCLHHHEKMDGSGYPHHLKGEEISLFARMGAVCDVYDAITSDRPYKKGWNPAESIRKMAEWSKGHFDEPIFQAFVKSVGIYPTGSLVRLESGRLGVVLEQHEQSLLTPLVKVFFSAKTKTPLMVETIDLSKLIGRDKIVARESAEDWGFRNIEELWSGIPSKRSLQQA